MTTVDIPRADAVPVDPVPGDSVLVGAVPVGAVPVDAVPVDPVLVDAVPVDAVPVDAVAADQQTDQPGDAEPARDGADAPGDQLTAADERLTDLTARLRTTDRQVIDGMSRVDERLGALDERVGALGVDIAALQHHCADHDRALGDVHRTIAAEVERHTGDALLTAHHSLQLAANSIAQLALAMAESSRDLVEDVSAESATALLDSFRVDLDAVLAQLGFSPLGAGVGDTFDPHRHRALKRIPTSDPARDKSITTVIRDGYRSTGTGRILLFADVEVGRLRT